MITNRGLAALLLPLLVGVVFADEPVKPPALPKVPVVESMSKSTGMKFILIPAGEFLMGSTPKDIQQVLEFDKSAKLGELSAEQPQHRVRITWPFYMGMYEVTQGAFQEVLGRNPSYFAVTGQFSASVAGKKTTGFPVENVSWYDTIEFCNKLSISDGQVPYYRLTAISRSASQSIISASVAVAGGTGYRLTTEAEWEYACRGNTTTPFHFGAKCNGTEANVRGADNPFGTPTAGPF